MHEGITSPPFSSSSSAKITNLNPERLPPSNIMGNDFENKTENNSNNDNITQELKVSNPARGNVVSDQGIQKDTENLLRHRKSGSIKSIISNNSTISGSTSRKASESFNNAANSVISRN